uniref:Uncharacterized protein n=1 Tax=Quercus lobata TaxID=97700 RepID=A0A7N2MKU3_QUELO
MHLLSHRPSYNQPESLKKTCMQPVRTRHFEGFQGPESSSDFLLHHHVTNTILLLKRKFSYTLEKTKEGEGEKAGGDQVSPEGQSRRSSAFTKQQRLVRFPTKRRELKEAQRSQANNGVLKCSLEVIVAITTFRSQTRQKIALSRALSAQILLSITSLFLCLRLRGTLFPHFSVTVGVKQRGNDDTVAQRDSFGEACIELVH